MIMEILVVTSLCLALAVLGLVPRESTRGFPARGKQNRNDFVGKRPREYRPGQLHLSDEFQSTGIEFLRSGFLLGVSSLVGAIVVDNL